MAGKIKGITIEFRGDTTKLDKALGEINKNTRALDKELKAVEKALKFNPTNVELWRQKQELLTKKVSDTKEQLGLLKQAQAQLDAKGVEKNSTEYETLQRKIIEAESKVKTFEGQLKKIGNVNLKATSEQFKQLGANLESAGRSMSGISKAAAAVVASIGALTVKSGQWADDINTMSKVYNIGTEDLQKYSAAADLVDVSVETIAGSQRKLTKSMSSAKKGTGTAAEAFDALGISVVDSNGELRNSDEVWQEVIKGLSGIENETERDALAMNLLGKSAQELNPLIEDGGETYKQVAETLKKYNLDFISQEDLENANKFNDELDMIKTIGLVAFQSIGTRLAGTLAPALEKVVGWVGKLAEWLGNLDPEVVAIIAGIAGVLAVVAPLLLGLGKMAFAISSIINLIGVIGPAIGALAAGPMLGIVAAIAAVIAIGVLLYKNWDRIKETARKVGAEIKEIWTSVKTSVVDSFRKMKESVVNTWETLKTKISEGAKNIRDTLISPFKKAKEKIGEFVEKIKSFFPIDIKELFSKIKLPHLSVEWSDITAFGKTISFPSGFDIEWYKKGGIFSSPSIIGVGEAGSEAVVPLDKFWDKLDNMSMASGGITINVYASDGMDENALALKIEQKLVQLQKQRAAAYGNI